MKRERKPQYRVIKTEDYVQNLHELSKQYGRLTELNDAIEWALARMPHKFNNIANDFYFWVTEELANPDFPKVKIVYRILESSSTVTLLTIEENLD